MDIPCLTIGEHQYTNDDLRSSDAQLALDSQGACNLCALTISFSEFMQWLMKNKINNGMDWMRKHPVVLLYTAQILFLTYGDTPDHCGLQISAMDFCYSVVRWGKEQNAGN